MTTRCLGRILCVAVFAALSALCGGADNTVAPSPSGTKPPASSDVWKPLRAFIGEWKGDVSGEPSAGTGEREYTFVLRDRFIRVSNKSTYPPQEKNPKGEVHEDVGYFSYDRATKKFVLRQFHIEGFVNQYVMESASSDSRTLTFVSTSIENIAPGWRARETYRFSGDNEFTETFELAEPGKDFAVYCQTLFRRRK
jgi:hypothetical protein